MNIFETLRAEHHIQRELMHRIAATEGDSDERRGLFAELKAELDDHATAEEVSLYRPLLGTIAHEKATHSIKEHEEIRELCDELAEMDFASPGWLRRFKSLKECVEHHLEEEEHEVFQLAGKALRVAEKKSLARTHEDQREELARA